MSTNTFVDNKYCGEFMRATNTPAWMTTERYDYCEPYTGKKHSGKGLFARLFLSALMVIR